VSSQEEHDRNNAQLIEEILRWLAEQDEHA
jgi:hypothetical protein